MALQPVSVTQLTQYIKLLLDRDEILSQACVRGELSNYKIHSSGHHYFTLKDEGAVISCVMFRSDAMRLRFRPETGMKVILSGRVSLFPKSGQYQIYVSHMQPDGVGDLAVAFEQLKKKLSAEGLFDPARKKPLPRYPGTVALVTSPTGAAVQDMIRILGRRWPLARVLVCPVRVQGAGAAEEIAAMLDYVDGHDLADVIITGRGGGSMEDLWAFNEEIVARAIARCDIPVISAVGHEPDVTIADFAADVRAATPSNGAEIAVCDQSELRDALGQLTVRLTRAQDRRISALTDRLNRLKASPVMRSPEGAIQQRELLLELLRQRLEHAGTRRFQQEEQRLARLAGRLDALSPLKVLARGYALASREDGTVIRAAGELAPGEPIRLRLGQGSARCTVDTIEKE
ncbi:MAG: exodeoxyribonuclease VII large subunit [Clostridia bacterium]|nr:exodeoxyribonuclease VII large subunit [Clostridia bacterium]MDD7672094.1 exodeoxyribonuclease VII large subunit [Clostridia bacterium]MDY2929817.1 exodeoxyribonuclease VII large subunit [Clostridiaceae bacterium]